MRGRNGRRILPGQLPVYELFVSEPEDNHGDLPSVAQHKGNFGVNVHYWKYINTNVNTFISGRRSRRPRHEDACLHTPAESFGNRQGIFRTMEYRNGV